MNFGCKLEGMFRTTMPARTRILWVLLFLVLLLPTGQASVIVGCPTFRYMVNGTCYICPDNCRNCTSDTNCSLCTMGFFGPTCENRCGEKCTGTCHKTFGHCTYGCPDGMYPAEGNGCNNCPLHCCLCESQSKCAKCEEGYFGEACQNRCPAHCTICNKTTGQCLQCKDSYFTLNGHCTSCPQGCGLCVSANTCSQCKDSYCLSDGVCKRCPRGCRICITADSCRSCEDGFQGPVHDRCLYMCPSNGVTTYNVPYEDGLCGIWQDTSTNSCHLQSESHSCTTSGNCLQDIRCPDSVRCVHETYASCATVMHYDCKRTCKQLLSIYGCEASCTVEARDNGKNRLLCMADIGSIDANIFQNTTETYCNQQPVTPTDSTAWSIDRIVLVVCVIVCVVTICTLIALISQRTCRRGFTKRNISKAVKDSKWKELTRPDNRTQINMLSETRSDAEQATETMLFMDNMSNCSEDEGVDGSRQQSSSQPFSTTFCLSAR